jgi:hypothetical protein
LQNISSGTIINKNTESMNKKSNLKVKKGGVGLWQRKAAVRAVAKPARQVARVVARLAARRSNI